MGKVIKRIIIILLCIILFIALVVGGYLLYVTLQYKRIPDYTPLEVNNQQEAVVQQGAEYSALTFNLGFGAYSPEFSFFMDEGTMKDGTKVKGISSRSASEENTVANTQGVISQLQANSSNFILLQEVDEKADRSWGVNQVATITSAFPEYSWVYASNFHTAYLAYPVKDPIGASESGLVTLSQFKNDSAVRRSYPVDESFPTKFFDLDRCFEVNRMPVEGGGELVLINSHMSAYDEGGLVREQQMKALVEMMQAERAKGNWVIVGGDFNHAFSQPLDAFASDQEVPEWVTEFDVADLPEGFRLVEADNLTTVGTCRASDIPYTKGVNYEVVVDGFLVSDNVNASATNLDLGYLYTDHNPVKMQFSLFTPEVPEGEVAAETVTP